MRTRWALARLEAELRQAVARYLTLFRSFSTRVVSRVRISIAFVAARRKTAAGRWKNLRPGFLHQQVDQARPRRDVPPAAPPSAFPSVPVMQSILPWRP